MKKENKVLHLYPRLLRYIYPYKLVIGLTILPLLGLAALEPVKAYILKLLLDEALIEQNPGFFIVIPLMIAGLFVLVGVLDYCGRVASQWISQKAILNIRSDMFAKLHRLPLATHHQYGMGNLMSKITYDVTMASSPFSNVWVVLIRDTLTILALLIYMMIVSWQLTLVLLVVVPVNVVLIDRASKKIRRASK